MQKVCLHDARDGGAFESFDALVRATTYTEDADPNTFRSQVFQLSRFRPRGGQGSTL